MLFADDAGDTLGIGQAAVLVKDNIADFHLFLFRGGQLCDRPAGADLAAEGAVVFTVAGAGFEDRGKHPLQAGLEKSRLQTIADADLHALSAADAAADKLFFRQGPGRADQEFVGLPGQGSALEKKRQQRPRSQGADKSTAGKRKSRFCPRLPAKAK